MFKQAVIFTLLVVFAFLLVSPPIIAQADDPPTGFRFDAPPYAVHGKYAIGVMTFDTADTTRPLVGHIWYPAINPEGLPESVVYDAGIGDLMPAAMNEFPGMAILDATPASDGGPYGVIVLSPGHGGSHIMLAYLAEHLASYGFVVIGFDHPGNSARESMMAQSEEAQAAFAESSLASLVTRPLDVTQALDYLTVVNESDGTLKGLLNLEHVGVTGLSLGGYTALAAAGARLNFAPLVDWCPQGIYSSILIMMSCNLHGSDILGFEEHLLSLTGVTAKEGDFFPSLGDSRVDAILPIVPGVMQAFGMGSGMSYVEVPTLLIHASADPVAIPEYNVLSAWQNISSSSKTLVTFENAGHVFGLGCNDGWRQGAPGYCTDPVWDIARTHDLLNHFEAAFFLSVLYSDAEAAAALGPDAVQFPGITYETTGY